MPRRELLTPAERAELFAFPADEGELIRLATLSKSDLDRRDWRTDNGADDPRIMEKELSGMSGSPVFRVFFDNDRKLVLDLIGFIMSDQLPYRDKLLMTSANNILTTGKLKHRPKR
jgi:hypothetical protein